MEAVLEDIPLDEAIALFGTRDENLRLLRDTLGLKVVARDRTITLRGPEEQVELGLKILARMREQFRAKKTLTPADIRMYLDAHSPGGATSLPAGMTLDASGFPPELGQVAIGGPLRRLKAKTPGQSRYVESIRDNALTFCIGPAGTGKTYLAVAMALEALHDRKIKRIVLVRPAVEAGEKLGFLPGDMQAKVHPYLRPLLDALREMLDFHQVRAYLENDVVEIAPLAFMRGRTLNESFIILDEAQNTTVSQMQMFLTRMGMGSRIVVTGDVTQVDLPPSTRSGLDDAARRLHKLKGVAVVELEKADIVRHPLVQAIVQAYEEER